MHRPPHTHATETDAELKAGTAEPGRPMNPRVTVGILSWNRKDALAVALESVRKQTIFPDTEVIVVDNNSTDGSREMVRERFPWVDLREREANSGLAEGRNILARLARAPVVFWMDDDCEIVETNALEMLVREIEENRQLAVVFARIVEGNNGRPHVSAPYDVPPEKYQMLKAFPSTFSSGGTCVRKQSFLDLGGYDGDFFRMKVERAFAYRAYGAGLCVCYLPRATIVHRPHRFGRNVRVITYYSHRNNLLGIWRYMPAGAAVVLTALECVTRLLRSIRSPSRLIGYVQATAAAAYRLPRCLLAQRRPVSAAGFSRWAYAHHYLIRSLDELGRLPDRYPLWKFCWMELKVRFLRHLGWSRPHPFRDNTEAAAVNETAAVNE